MTSTVGVNQPRAQLQAAATGAVAQYGPSSDDTNPTRGVPIKGSTEKFQSSTRSHTAVISGVMGRDRIPDIYDRFSPKRKSFITALVSYNAFLSPMTASIFLPSIPAIASDLSATPTLINITVAIFIIAIATAPLIWSPLCGFYGRKPIYLASMPIMLVSTIGVAFSKTVPQLIATRVLQGIGSSSPLAVGAGVIGDIYRPTERSNAMGWFYTGAVLGPSLSPLVGAAFTEYTASSWRGAQYFLIGCAGLSIFLTFFFLPETMPSPIPHHVLRAERGKTIVPFIFNPLSILGLFGWPNISAITLISGAAMLTTYILLVPLTSAFGEQYGITNSIIIGCFFLASGGGNFAGSRIAGPMADAMVRRYIAKRGHRRPEDRLRASVFGLSIMMPLTCLAYGWLIQTGAGGVGPPVVCLFLQGIALMLVVTPVNTYAVDCMQSRSAECIAVNNWVRYLFAAAASAFVLPMAHSIGWGLTMTVAAGVTWIAFGILLATIRYGHVWRERANLRYGYDVSEDEKHDTSNGSSDDGKLAEDGNGDSASRRQSTDPEHEKDVPTELPSRKCVPALATTDGGRRLERKKSSGLSRQASRSSMPEVKDVLRRTTSLTDGAVHGGG